MFRRIDSSDNFLFSSRVSRNSLSLQKLVKILEPDRGVICFFYGMIFHILFAEQAVVIPGQNKKPDIQQEEGALVLGYLHHPASSAAPPHV